MKKMLREVRVKDLYLYWGLNLLIIIAIWIAFTICLIKFSRIYLFLPLALILSYYPLKNHIIGMVLMYKAFAPMHVRQRCRFQPTCSTYMIMAIKKYGLFKGVIKGINRLSRCKPPNGGIDLP